MDISTIANFIKLPKKVIFIFCLLSTVVLFSEKQFLTDLALYDFREKYKLWLGAAFLFSLGVTVLNIIEFIISIIKDLYKKNALEQEDKNQKKKIIASIKYLDNHELAVIREFFIQKKNTVEMSIEDSTVLGLIKKGIVKQVGRQGYNTNFTDAICYFELNSTVQNYSKLIELINNSSIARPKWIDQIAVLEAIEEQKSETLKMIQQIQRF